MKRFIDLFDSHFNVYVKEKGVDFLRYSLALIFIWFGALKPLGLSPASDLAAKTVYWFDPAFFVPILGYWEVIIGICLLFIPLLRFGLILMAFQMAGTFLPIIILPEVVFTSFPFVLTMEGQYIVKNLVLIAAALVIASHIHENKGKKK